MFADELEMALLALRIFDENGFCRGVNGYPLIGLYAWQNGFAGRTTRFIRPAKWVCQVCNLNYRILDLQYYRLSARLYYNVNSASDEEKEDIGFMLD